MQVMYEKGRDDMGRSPKETAGRKYSIRKFGG
jgi:hypothetical protein